MVAFIRNHVYKPEYPVLAPAKTAHAAKSETSDHWPGSMAADAAVPLQHL
jgi:hypothetical protein